MEELQQSIEQVIQYHKQQTVERVPQLQIRLAAVEVQINNLSSLQCRLPRHLKIPALARFEREKTDLLAEIHKLSDATLLRGFERSVQKQVAQMIVDPIDDISKKTNPAPAVPTTVTLPPTSAEANLNINKKKQRKRKRDGDDQPSKEEDDLLSLHPLPSQPMYQWQEVRVAQQRQIVPVDLKEEEVESEAIQDEGAQVIDVDLSKVPSSSWKKGTEKVSAEQREFILSFVQLGVPVDMHATPMQSSAAANVMDQGVVDVKKRRVADQYESRYHRQFCSICRRALLFVPNEAKMVCVPCSVAVDHVDTISHTLSMEGDLDTTTSAYARPTHLMEIIEPFRPRKYVQIPQIVIDGILGFIRQDRCGLTRELTFAKVDAYLKNQGYKDMYKHKYQITMQLNNKFWPIMSETQERNILFTFIEMQKSFERVKKIRTSGGNEDASRSSFPKYDLSVFHICRLLGYHEFCPFLKGLQVPVRHIKQLRLLKLIFLDMKSDYTPEQR